MTRMGCQETLTLKISAKTAPHAVSSRCNFAPDSPCSNPLIKHQYPPCHDGKPCAYHGINPTTEYHLSTNRKDHHRKGPSAPATHSGSHLMTLFSVETWKPCVKSKDRTFPSERVMLTEPEYFP